LDWHAPCLSYWQDKWLLSLFETAVLNQEQVLLANVFLNVFGGYFFLFGNPCTPDYDDTFGRKSLLGFSFLAFAIIPFARLLVVILELDTFVWSNLFIVAIVATVLFLTIKYFLSSSFGKLGFKPWRTWTLAEKNYLYSAVPLFSAVFTLMFWAYLSDLFRKYGLVEFVLFSVVTGLVWGFTQEVIFRGMLQTEFDRRFGPWVGVLSANFIFTFGPLHFNYYNFGADANIQWGMFGVIFAIGLLFGVLYQRSGNLWLPAIFHGMWPLNMT